MKKQLSIDLNADLGESFGIYHLGNDSQIMKFISSANIACGFHAGDPPVILSTIKLSKEAGVAVGAHPGYPDLQGFGRRSININPDQLYAFILYQAGALKSIAESVGAALSHVKPHGALYNDSVRERAVADAIASAVYDLDPSLMIYGPPNSKLENESLRRGLYYVIETFADRTYNSDGTLMSRNLKDAVIHDPEEVAERALTIVTENRIPLPAGGSLIIKPGTICLHGDHPSAILNAQKVAAKLSANGVIVKSVVSE